MPWRLLAQVLHARMGGMFEQVFLAFLEREDRDAVAAEAPSRVMADRASLAPIAMCFDSIERRCRSCRLAKHLPTMLPMGSETSRLNGGDSAAGQSTK